MLAVQYCAARRAIGSVAKAKTGYWCSESVWSQKSDPLEKGLSIRGP
jgi:hypothetical protein